jgi:hypothetical protein
VKTGGGYGWAGSSGVGDFRGGAADGLEHGAVGEVEGGGAAQIRAGKEAEGNQAEEVGGVALNGGCMEEQIQKLSEEMKAIAEERDWYTLECARLLEEVGQLNARWTTEMRQRYIEGLNVALSQLWGGGTKQDAIDAITKLIQAEQYKWVKEGGAK